MAKPLVSDELWAIVEPLIPKVERRYRFPGRMRIDDRSVLTGTLFVLQTGIPWEYLPQEMGCGSGMTCWRHTLSRGRGTPLALAFSAGNHNDILHLLPMVDEVQPFRAKRRRPRN